MAFLLTNTTQHRRRTITGLMADTLTVKTHTIGTHLTEMTRTIKFMTGWYLGVVFDEYLIFPKLEEAGDRLEYSYTIMVEAVLDVWGQRVFAIGVMQDFAKGSETFNNGQV